MPPSANLPLQHCHCPAHLGGVDCAYRDRLLPGHSQPAELLAHLDHCPAQLMPCQSNSHSLQGSTVQCRAPCCQLAAACQHLFLARLLLPLQVRVFYTAPTLIRSLEAADIKYVRQHDRSSLAVLGTVGEPINLAAWRWYHEVGCCGPQEDVRPKASLLHGSSVQHRPVAPQGGLGVHCNRPWSTSCKETP